MRDDPAFGNRYEMTADAGAANADAAGGGRYLHAFAGGARDGAGDEHKGALGDRDGHRVVAARRIVDQLVDADFGVAAEREFCAVDESDFDFAVGIRANDVVGEDFAAYGEIGRAAVRMRNMDRLAGGGYLANSRAARRLRDLRRGRLRLPTALGGRRMHDVRHRLRPPAAARSRPSRRSACNRASTKQSRLDEAAVLRPKKRRSS
jgi:hypothetical protein